MYTKFLFENMKGNLRLDGWITLALILKEKKNENMWSGFRRLRMGSTGRLL
jgi:hypothetical protein